MQDCSFFLINLSKRSDRLAHFQKEWDREMPGVNWNRFEAIDGNSHQFTPDEIRLFRDSDFVKNRSMFIRTLVGNQLSHLYVIRRICDENIKLAVIFQDDVVLKHGFREDLQTVLDNLPTDAEIVTIGLHKFGSGSKFISWPINNDYNVSEFTNDTGTNPVVKLKHGVNPCSLAYIITLNGAKRFLAHIEEVGARRATDGNFNDYLEERDIFYGTRKILCTGNPELGSDVFIVPTTTN
jgi:GR25 family glycosyltransferase involved in LPS biosynthesis